MVWPDSRCEGVNLLMVGIEIRGLDGERKSLVYDNYSKLIVATDTIAKASTQTLIRQLWDLTCHR